MYTRSLRCLNVNHSPNLTHRKPLQVPSDAWTMDFVFADSSSTQSGGFFDNNNGWDYHINVAGSSIAPPKLNVVHIAVEMAPIAKVGIP